MPTPALKDNPAVEVVVPKSGVLAGVYVQAISAFAPHPNAAKLWMEYLYSDEGQLVWLKGYGRRELSGTYEYIDNAAIVHKFGESAKNETVFPNQILFPNHLV